MTNINGIPPEQYSVGTKVLAYAQAKDPSFSFDPATIMAICNCIIAVIKLLYMCYGKRNITSKLRKPSLLQKILLKREVRKHYSKEDRNTMYTSMLDVSRTLSETELQKLTDSIQE